MIRKPNVNYKEITFDVSNGKGEEKWDLAGLTILVPKTIADWVAHLGEENTISALSEHHKIRSQDRARQVHRGSKNKTGEWVRRPGSDAQAREAAQTYEFGTKTRIQAVPRRITPEEYKLLPRNEREAYLASLIAADNELTKGE